MRGMTDTGPAPADWEGALLELLGDVIPGVPGRAAGTMPFGKYAGQPASAVLADEDYCRWLLDQDWLYEKHPAVQAWLREKFPPPPPYMPPPAAPPVETARYPYRDEAGALRYTVIRYAPKAFAIEAADGSPLPDPVPRDLAVLYRLPELLAAPPGSTVYVCEGEKDADAVAALGLAAVSNPCGTRMGWLGSYTPHLAGYHAVILPDADGPGRRHAEKVTAALSGTALSVVTCDLNGGQRGPWDVCDWLARRGRGAGQLAGQAARARFAAAGRAWRKGGPNRDEREDLVWSSGLASTAKLALAAACYLTGWKDGGAWPPAAAIGAAASLHRVTAQNAVTGLRRAGVLAPGGGIAWDVLVLS